MAAIGARAGTVKVVVKNVPRWFLLGMRGTVTIEKADFVGMTVADAVRRVKRMRRWRLLGSCILNGREMIWNGIEASRIVLNPGDQLEVEDP